MNKTHIASAGVGGGFIGLALSAFFPHTFSADQMAVLVGLIPPAFSVTVAVVEAVFPKAAKVITAAEEAVPNTPEPPTPPVH